MNLDTLATLLAYCLVVNLTLLFWWALFMLFASEWVYKMHSRWFDLDKKQFYAIHYGALAGFKLVIFVFNFAPYVAVRTILG